MEEDRFESQFERDVCECIRRRGFFVRTQVCVGDFTNHRYRIDLVVEGMKGRLAVECDGDQWHGPERYEQDMARQRNLEHAGWQFVRIRGSDFYRDQTKALEHLWKELDRLGIKPGGIERNGAEPPPPAKTARDEGVRIDDIIEPEPGVITHTYGSRSTFALTPGDYRSADRDFDATVKEINSDAASSICSPVLR